MSGEGSRRTRWQREIRQGLQLFEFAESLGGVTSQVEHPDTMSHVSMPAEARSAAGITGANIRVSVGIESREDLIEDMTRGLELSQT